jgi:hypothetical protein
MQLIIEVRLIIVDDDHQRNFVLHSCPNGIAAHHEIAIAQNADGLFAKRQIAKRPSNYCETGENHGT